MEIRGSVEIGRPTEDVFAYMPEAKNYVEWESAVVEMEMTSDGPAGVGSKGRRLEKYMGTDESSWEVTEYKENEALAVTFESARFAGEVRWELESAGEGTRLSYRLRGEPKGVLVRLMMLVMMPMVRGPMGKDYQRLKQILESKS